MTNQSARGACAERLSIRRILLCRAQKDHSIASTATLAMTELRLMLEEEQVPTARRNQSRLVSRRCALQRARQESEVRLIVLTDQLNSTQAPPAKQSCPFETASR